MDLKARLSPDHRPVALEYASFLRCLDKATRHGIGEAVNVYANLLLKKREHLMSLSSPSVPSSIKSSVVFAPLAECKLLPPERIKETTTRFRHETETSALVSVVASSRPSTSRSFFRGSSSAASSSYSYPSPLLYRRGRGLQKGKSLLYRNRRGYAGSNTYYFGRRDRFYRSARPKPKPQQQQQQQQPPQQN